MFFVLSAVKSFEMFPRYYDSVATISEPLALNLIIFVPLTNK